MDAKLDSSVFSPAAMRRSRISFVYFFCRLNRATHLCVPAAFTDGEKSRVSTASKSLSLEFRPSQLFRTRRGRGSVNARARASLRTYELRHDNRKVQELSTIHPPLLPFLRANIGDVPLFSLSPPSPSPPSVRSLEVPLSPAQRYPSAAVINDPPGAPRAPAE